MFTEIKQQTDLLHVIEHYTGVELKEAGDNTYELESRQCPLPDCGHYDCFRIKKMDRDELGVDQSYYKCFSCDSSGDAIKFIEQIKGLEPAEAGKELISDLELSVEIKSNPIQAVFTTAADYYHQNLLDSTKKLKTLDLKTPMEYQEKSRGHSRETISRAKVGFTDGSLKDFLESIGYDQELGLETGLLKQFPNGDVRDYFRGGFFIYPHFVKGRVSTFTIKDPEKQVEYQLPKKRRINGVTFYAFNADSEQKQLALVEGENDLLSMLDKGWTGAIMAIIGQISRDQIKALAEDYGSYDIVTFFDRDDAGNKYRAKVSKIVTELKSLHHAHVPEPYGDIDDYLQDGGSLVDLIKQAEKVEDQGLEVEEQDDNLSVKEDKGRYFRIAYDKDGEPRKKILSDFVIKLTSVYLRGNERNREVVIRRSDGAESTPEYIDSETKVNLRKFKVFVANAIDATFYGSETDLADLWKRVYTEKPPKLVNVPFSVGFLDSPRYRGWMFRNSFIDLSGNLLEPNDDGIFWLDPQEKTGIRPTSLSANENADLSDVPMLNFIGEPRHRKEVTRTFIEMLGKNLGSLGDALTIVSWARANCYSDVIYKKYGFFPFLFLWGRHGKGKTNITKWVLSLFDMQEQGYTTIPQLGSNVGFVRKAGYYSGLPMAIDEVRRDRETKEKYSFIRALYNKSTRTKGVQEDFGVKSDPIRANFMFAGEDIFDDSALSSRCLPVKIKAQDRELYESYQWLESHRPDLSGIGLEWIIESMHVHTQDILVTMMDASRRLMDEHGCTSRTAQSWSIIYAMGQQLVDQYLDGFDLWDYITSVAVDIQDTQEADSVINKLFEVVEGLQEGRMPTITADHIVRENDTLHIWFAEVHRLVAQASPELRDWTKRYFLETIREEPYYIREGREYLGNQKRRRVISLDLTKAPEVICNIAQHHVKTGMSDKESQDKDIDSRM